MKIKLNPKVDKFLIDGCMRCKFGGTPQCKVNNWREELETLRQIVLESGLTEEIKWGFPCYTLNNKNVLMISAFKEYVALSFFKGILLPDPDNLLEKQGDNAQSWRVIKFTDTGQIISREKELRSYIQEAIKIEKSGKKITVKKNPEPIPEELSQAFEADAAFRKAFYNLTPGRQRGYNIYFSQPKQSQTRVNRIEKYKEQIKNGIGLHDKYKC